MTTNSGWRRQGKRGLLPQAAFASLPWWEIAGWAIIAGLAVFLARAPISWGILLVGGALAVGVTLVRPALGLGFLALLVPFGSLREIPLGPASVGLAEFYALFVITAWLIDMAAWRRVYAAPSRLWLGLGFLLGAMLLSLTQALSLRYAVKELSKWLEFGGVMLCAASLPNAGERKIVLGASLTAGIAAALLGWYQFLRGVGPEGFILFGRFMRAYGTFRQPNPYAGYLGILLPIGLAMVISYWPWRAGASWGERVLWTLGAAGVLTMGPAMLMSWSRGGWFGAVAAVLAVLLLHSRRTAFLAVTAALVLTGMFIVMELDRLLPASLVLRVTNFTDYFTLGDVSGIVPTPANWAVVERLAHWQAAERMFAAHPWLGVGIGNYEPAYPAYRLPRWPEPLGHAHNYYLHIAAETGLIGALAYGLFWAGAIWQAWQARRRNAGVWRGLALGTLGVIAHLSVHNLFDNLYVQGIYLQIALWLGLIIPLARASLHEKRDTVHVQAGELGAVLSGQDPTV